METQHSDTPTQDSVQEDIEIGSKLILQSQFDIKKSELEFFARIHNIPTDKSTLTNSSLELHINELKYQHTILLQKYTIKPILISYNGKFSFSDFFIKNYPFEGMYDNRHDPKLINFIQTHGLQKCSGENCTLKIEYIPLCTCYIINKCYDCETITINHFDLYPYSY